MSKTDLVRLLLRRPIKLSRVEKFLLEMKLLTRIYQELAEIFKSRYEDYQQLIKPNFNQEKNMDEMSFMREIINDIVLSEEYSLAGIFTHTRIPEEVLYDLATGINTNPTFHAARKLFELHILVKRDLYDGIMRKIILDYLPENPDNEE